MKNMSFCGGWWLVWLARILFLLELLVAAAQTNSASFFSVPKNTLNELIKCSATTFCSYYFVWASSKWNISLSQGTVLWQSICMISQTNRIDFRYFQWSRSKILRQRFWFCPRRSLLMHWQEAISHAWLTCALTRSSCMSARPTSVLVWNVDFVGGRAKVQKRIAYLSAIKCKHTCTAWK